MFRVIWQKKIDAGEGFWQDMPEWLSQELERIYKADVQAVTVGMPPNPGTMQSNIHFDLNKMQQKGDRPRQVRRVLVEDAEADNIHALEDKNAKAQAKERHKEQEPTEQSPKEQENPWDELLRC